MQKCSGDQVNWKTRLKLKYCEADEKRLSHQGGELSRAPLIVRYYALLLRIESQLLSERGKVLLCNLFPRLIHNDNVDSLMRLTILELPPSLMSKLHKPPSLDLCTSLIFFRDITFNLTFQCIETKRTSELHNAMQL